MKIITNICLQTYVCSKLQKNVSFEEQIISKDKYASMFLHKIEAVVFIILQTFCNAYKKNVYKHPHLTSTTKKHNSKVYHWKLPQI